VEIDHPGFDDLGLQLAARELQQALLKVREIFHREARRQRNLGGEVFIKDLPVVRGHEQADLLQQPVMNHHHVREQLAPSAPGYHFFYRIAIRMHKPPGAQLGAAEVARHHHRHISQAAPLQNSQRRPASRPRRLPGIAAVGDDRAAEAHQESRDMVRGIWKLSPDASDKRFGLVNRKYGRQAGDKTRIDHDNLMASFAMGTG
jgi:hypothetical protein